MSTRSYALALGACASLLLTACGGGGGGSTTPLPAATPAAGSSTHSSARATATITIPKKVVVQMNAAMRKAASSAKRSPKYVSPNTAGVFIQANRSDGYDEGSVTAASATSNGCTTNGNGSVTCVVPFNAPATTGTQTDEFIVQLLDYPDQYSGDILAFFDQTGYTVTPGGTNTFQFVCGGVEGQAPELSPDTTVTDAYGATIPVTEGADTNVYPLAFEWNSATTISSTANQIVGLLDAPMIITISNGNAFWDMPTGAGYTVSTTTNPNDTLSIADTSVFMGPAKLYVNPGTTGTTVTASSSGLNSNTYASAYYGLPGGPAAQLTTTYALQAQ